jgi:hypothetical protein
MPAPATLERPDAPKSGKNPSANSSAAPAAGGAPAAAGCPKCGNLESWGATSWCPRCGYYPKLGTSVVTDDPASQTTVAPPTGYLEALARLPKWSYVLAVGVLGIFIMSVAVRVTTEDDGFARSAWSLMQLLVGGMTFVVVHVYAFIRGGMKASGLSGFDVITRPIEVWRPSFRELPATARRIWIGAWGFTAAVCAMLIIGGIRYSALTDDWGFKARPKQNLLKKIKEQAMANAEDGAKDLDEAIKDFAGDEEVKKKDKKKKKEEADLEMLSAECLVIGYNVDKKTGQVHELILASLIDEKLQFAGIVSGGIPGEIQRVLQEKLPLIEQETPFLKCPVSARWVKPVVSCRAAFKEWNKSKRMQKPVLKELLDEVKVK